jgi:hypothetical protein
MSSLLSIFKSTSAFWRFSVRPVRKRCPNEITTATLNSHRLVNFLSQMGYERRVEGRCRYLDFMPENLLRFWLRGLSDGDGCWSIRKERYLGWNVSAPYSQDWNFLTAQLGKLDLVYQQYRSQKPNSSYSYIQILSKESAKKFGSFIYDSFEVDGIGLDRKYQIYLKGSSI